MSRISIEALALAGVSVVGLLTKPQAEVGLGYLAESLGYGLYPRGGHSRWNCDRVNGRNGRLHFTQPDLPVPQSREWADVPRDHHVPRHRH